MSPALIALAFAASTLPALLAWVPGGELIGASQLGIALTVWIALASVPSYGSTERRVRTSLAFALPPLALAAALDLRAGARLDQVPITLLEGIAMLEALTVVSRRAEPSTPRWTLYEAAWLLLLVGPVLARFALDFGLGEGGAPQLFAQLARWSPLGWALELCTNFGRAHEHPWRPTIVVVGLILLAARSWRPSEARA